MNDPNGTQIPPAPPAPKFDDAARLAFADTIASLAHDMMPRSDCPMPSDVHDRVGARIMVLGFELERITQKIIADVTGAGMEWTPRHADMVAQAFAAGMSLCRFRAQQRGLSGGAQDQPVDLAAIDGQLEAEARQKAKGARIITLR